jgi:hypothetical protein
MQIHLMSVSNILVTISFWVGIPFLLLGMLLILGFQSKHPIAIAISAIGFAGTACWGLGLCVEGLVTGEALSISRHSGTVTKTQSITGYWTAMAFWFLLTLAIICASCWRLALAVKVLTGRRRPTADSVR